MRHKDKDKSEFPAGDDICRAARDRCARACHAYNMKAEFLPVEQRSALYHAIINSSATAGRSFLDLDRSVDQIDTTAADARIENAPSTPSPSVVVPAAETTINSTTTTTTFNGGSDHHPSLGTWPAAASAACLALSSQSRHSSSNYDPSHHAANNPSLAGTSSSTTSHASPSQGPVQPLLQAQTQPSHTPSHLTKSSDQRFPGQEIAPFIKPPLYMDYGSKVQIGNSTFINRNCKILDTPVRYIRIGERCLIGPDFSIYAVEHPVEFDLRCGPAGVPSYGLEVTIGNDVWIGGHVTILGGVSIGDGCVIGANSLVTRDIPAYHLAYGSPARVVRRLKQPENFSILSAWIARLRETFNLQRMRSRSDVLQLFNVDGSSLAVGASLCTAVAAFLYLQLSTND